jgi:hypothetical protein
MRGRGGEGDRLEVRGDPDMRAPLAAGERGEKRGRGSGPRGPEGLGRR